MNKWKKFIATLLVIAMALSLVACGAGESSTDTQEPQGNNADVSQNDAVKAPKAAKIGVAFYADNGPAVDGTKAYLESLSETLNCEFVYTVLTQTDEAVNLTKIQELISAGCDGIICSMDLGMQSIIAECEAAGVYIGGWLSDYNTSFTTAYADVFQNEYFVGTVADGPCGDDMATGYHYFDSLIEYNERNPENPITHVSVTAFPTWAFPNQAIQIQQFYDAVEEYNKTAETPITADPLDEATDVLQFAPIDSTYFAKHPGIQAIMSFAADSFVYPVMVSSGVDDEIKLFVCGYSTGNELNFGTNGTQTYQQCMCSAVEAITYPLVLVLNKINGVQFADQPADAERVSVNYIIINSDEDMAKFAHSMAFTTDTTYALLTPEEVLNLTAFGNPDATYAALAETLQHMTIDDVK